MLDIMMIKGIHANGIVLLQGQQKQNETLNQFLIPIL